MFPRVRAVRRSKTNRYAEQYCNGIEVRIKSRAITKLRTDDAIMHKNRVAQKRKIAITFNGATMEECATVLQAINPEYIDVYYYDPMDGQFEIRTFYVGDRTAPFKSFWVGNRRVERLSFDIIER